MAAGKYKNPELDGLLFPVFVQMGTVGGVFGHCREENIGMTKPTLTKMAHYFGWKKRRAEAVAQQSAAATKTGNPLADLLIETRLQKEAICRELQLSPANEGLNRIYANLIETELKILKEIKLAKSAEEVAGAVEKAGGLTKETADTLRAQILGIGK
ncbi:MAG: hypothetical protein HY243_12285 [Proteobacteria bacterium]|nr:hypothetical protein [Pseudomonadota bacterium]